MYEVAKYARLQNLRGCQNMRGCKICKVAKYTRCKICEVAKFARWQNNSEEVRYGAWLDCRAKTNEATGPCFVAFGTRPDFCILIYRSKMR
jgi:hypothetical protein